MTYACAVSDDGEYHTTLERVASVLIYVGVGSIHLSSRRELSEDVSLGIGTLSLVVEQPSLENRRRGCVIVRIR